MSSSTFSVFVFQGILYLCLTQCTYTQNVDSPCKMQSGAPGICKPRIHHCDLWAMENEGVTYCHNEESKLFCCPKKQSISMRKCMEYSEMKCSDTDSYIAISRTIFKGDIVDSVEEFPHMALLGYDTGRGVEWTCGGTLISEQFILTAAHCLNYNRAPVSLVNLGFMNRNDINADTIQQFRVIERIRHPNRTVSQWYNDLALLKLDRPVQLTDAVFPACLHEDADIPSTTVQAIGFGVTETLKLSDELRKTTLKILDQVECDQGYFSEKKLPRGILEESQFCAGGNSKDTCNGDSGGPALIRQGNECLHRVVGITSVGFDCAGSQGKTPSIFTRVSHFLPWIESIVWRNQ